MSETPRYVFNFGDGAPGNEAAARDLLGGKGASLAEMTRMGLPVPPGFTISTDAARAYWANGNTLPEAVKAQVRAALAELEVRTGARLGDPDKPLLVAVRSGAAASMPGMMDTVLNLGINDQTVGALARRTDNARFAYDSYRRFLQMYANVVMEMPADILDALLERMKDAEEVVNDARLSVGALEELCEIYERKIFESTGHPFPKSPTEQLWRAIDAVFRSWNNRRALDYRNAASIPHDLGTAVNIQAMVFGNMGETSGTGVAFTRDPNTGAAHMFGEWLPNAQGEDVVSGIRTPQALNEASGALSVEETLAHALPQAYQELTRIQGILERHYRDMQDIEFTVQEGKLWMLQTRTGKRSPAAEVKLAVDMVDEGLIDQQEAIRRVRTETLVKLMHPRIDPDAERTIIAQGLGASPGAATGRLAFSADDAVERTGRGEAVILLRRETSPEDIHGMLKAQGILTARGGMTSHAAVVARGLSKACIVGCRDLVIDPARRSLIVHGKSLGEEDVVTIDGAEGTIMLGAVVTIKPSSSQELERLMGWVDTFRRLRVRTNADTARDCTVARDFGAEGIGLCRTEHMFFNDDRILSVREMILAADEAGRRAALARLLPMQEADFEAIFRVMEGLPVTIRLLDPPLHEFLAHEEGDVRAMAAHLGLTFEEVDTRYSALQEVNPMLGHRGCRLGITYPEIYEMQVTAIMQAACRVAAAGVDVRPEIMIPLVSHRRELDIVREMVTTTADGILAKTGVEVAYEVGTMIELPRACLTADAIAHAADFFSFGTNDLTQTTFGVSRDDSGRFLPLYVEMGILPRDPFVALDEGVRELIRIATNKGRAVKPGMKVGICGEHGGEAETIRFCHAIGLDYVSCSPFRVPIARLAAAKAALEEPA